MKRSEVPHWSFGRLSPLACQSRKSVELGSSIISPEHIQEPWPTRSTDDHETLTPGRLSPTVWITLNLLLKVLARVERWLIGTARCSLTLRLNLWRYVALARGRRLGILTVSESEDASMLNSMSFINMSLPKVVDNFSK